MIETQKLSELWELVVEGDETSSSVLIFFITSTRNLQFTLVKDIISRMT